MYTRYVKPSTNDKGDVGLALVMADLIKKGYNICLPLSEHLPFDLVAVDAEGRLAKVQVKYVAVNAAKPGKPTLHRGVIRLPCRSSYSNSKGSRHKPHDFSRFDAYGVYCPDNGGIYYVSVLQIPEGATEFSLRIEPAPMKNKNIRWASDYEDEGVIFWTTAGSSAPPDGG